MVFTKEELDKKLKFLEGRLPKIIEKAKTAPREGIVETKAKTFKVNPKAIATKSVRKVTKKIKHIKKLIAQAS